MHTLTTILLILLTAVPAGAQVITSQQARTVAESWTGVVIRQSGDWNGALDVSVSSVEPIPAGNDTVGYLCRIEPRGYVAVSVLRGLSPVKAYSTTSNLDLGLGVGMPAMLVFAMERSLRAVESSVGRTRNISAEDVLAVVERDYSDAWAALLGDSPRSDLREDYQSQKVLVKSHWHQFAPYFNQCPVPGLLDNCDSAHCTVGCVATAGAQIMRYWQWPPRGVGEPYYYDYEWALMPWRIVWDSIDNRWEEAFTNVAITQAQIDAAARINREVGLAVDMNYCGDPIFGSCASGATTSDMEAVYQDIFRYATACDVVVRDDFSSAQWFDRLKLEFNANRPVQYRIYGHSLIADGWRVYYIGESEIEQFHMNYGWGVMSDLEDGADTWYDVDDLFYPAGGGADYDYAVVNIRPNVSFNGSFSGFYPQNGSFPWRYVDRDVDSEGGFFEAGQLFQFLPGVSITCSATDSSVWFEGIGSSISNCRMFSGTDRTRGMRIYRGKLRLTAGGGVRVF